MGYLPAALKTALAAGAQPIGLLTIGPISGTTYRSASAGVASAGTGQFKSQVVNWGIIKRARSDERSGNIKNSPTTVTIKDQDRTFSKLVEGADGDLVRGATATIELGAVGVAAANWATLFSGTVAAWDWQGIDQLTWSLRPNDAGLLHRFPRYRWLITRPVFPLAHADVLNKLAPLLYGNYSSAAFTNTGFIPGLLIDTTGTKRHLLAAGRIKSVTTVFVDGVETADATFDVLRKGGRDWSTIIWGSDPGDDVAITADVVGYEATGDGTGAVITNPAAQLRHALNNFMFGDFERGDWATSDHANVDGTSFDTAETYFDNHGYGSAKWLDAEIQGSNLLAEWAKAHEAAVFMTRDGKIGCGVEDPTVETIYYSDPWWKHNFPTKELLDYKRDDRNRLDQLTIKYVFDPASGNFVHVLDIANPGRDPDSRESQDVKWGPTE